MPVLTSLIIWLSLSASNMHQLIHTSICSQVCSCCVINKITAQIFYTTMHEKHYPQGGAKRLIKTTSPKSQQSNQVNRICINKTPLFLFFLPCRLSVKSCSSRNATQGTTSATPSRPCREIVRLQGVPAKRLAVRLLQPTLWWFSNWWWATAEGCRKKWWLNWPRPKAGTERWVWTCGDYQTSQNLLFVFYKKKKKNNTYKAAYLAQFYTATWNDKHLKTCVCLGDCRPGGGKKEACWGHSRGRWCHLHPWKGEGAPSTTGNEHQHRFHYSCMSKSWNISQTISK